MIANNQRFHHLPDPASRRNVTLYPALFLLAFTLPIGIRFPANALLPVSMTLPEIVAYPLGFVLIIASFVRAKSEYSKKSRSALPSILALTMLTSSSYSFLANTSPLPMQAFKDCLPGIILMLSLMFVEMNVNQIKRLLMSYAAGISTVIVVSLLQYKFHWLQSEEIEAAAYTVGKTDFSGRILNNVVTGFETHPNNLATMLAPSLILISVYLALTLKSYIGKINLFIVMALGVYILYLTQSKGAIFFFLIGYCTLIIPAFLLSAALQLSIIFSASFALIMYAFAETASDASSTLGTIWARVQLWQIALQGLTIPTFAVFGDMNAYIDIESDRGGVWHFVHAHNAWLNFAVYFGLPAAACFILTWIRAMQAVVISALSSTANIRYLGRSIFAATTCMGGIMMFEGLLGPSRFGLLWFLIGLSFAARRLALIISIRAQNEPCSIRIFDRASLTSVRGC